MSDLKHEQLLAARIRAARGLLGWSQKDLAAKAGVSRSAIARMELGIVDIRTSTLRALEDIFRNENIVFIEKPDCVGALLMLKEKPIQYSFRLVEEEDPDGSQYL